MRLRAWSGLGRPKHIQGVLNKTRSLACPRHVLLMMGLEGNQAGCALFLVRSYQEMAGTISHRELQKCTLSNPTTARRLYLVEVFRADRCRGIL
jgi:hypothetical protein